MIPADDLAQAMKCSVDAKVEFAKKYSVSLDWLLGGDLKALQRMTRERCARRVMTATVMETEA